MNKAMYVNPVGLSGGLAIWWTNEVGISFKHISKNVVDNEVQIGANGSKFHISWIYGDPDFRRRAMNWDRLKVIGAWLLLGDFNDICHH